MSKRYIIAREKNRFTRGTSWTGSLFNILVITANLKLFEGFIAPNLPTFISMQMLYLAAIPAYIIFHWCLGLIDERRGIWKEENNYMYEVFPEANDQKKQVAYIHEWVLKQEMKK